MTSIMQRSGLTAAPQIRSFATIVAPRRVSRGIRSRTVASFGSSVSDPSGDALQIISSIVTVSSLVGGAYLLLREDQSQAESQESQEHRPSTRCPSCHGQGTEECMCVRWSDGDKGCATCNQTGLMKCRRCGGGGTAVPALIKVRKERQ